MSEDLLKRYMDVDDWEEISEIPEKEGIFRVKYHRLSLRALRNLRSRLTNKVWALRREVAGLYDRIELLEREIREKEEMLKLLGEDRIRAWTEMERKRQDEAHKRSVELLKKVIGPEHFQELQTKGFFTFEGFDKKTYRVKLDGQLQVLEGEYWVAKCVIRPDVPGLPLPDFMASVFIATTQDPSFLGRSRRLTSRREEVTA